MVVMAHYCLLLCVSGIFFYSLWNEFLIVYPIKVKGKAVVQSDNPSEFDLNQRIKRTNLTLKAFFALFMGLVLIVPLLYMKDSYGNSDDSIIKILMPILGLGLFKIGVVYLLLSSVFILTLAEHILFRLKFKARRFAFEEEEKEKERQA
ncbi:hypothetical protein [Bacillus subtilis]|uniref:hypothetical protein n=1 Tax=Bacillus subtilis TaxID=1423 RepID=UPI00084A05ED|nr:hypothetical protein [Bacillus subtilis]ODV47915.1 hypothetical protein BCM26_05770 [Bacillus subtilis]OJH63513.1 hypothetical protein BOH71_09710 [Bacillus subtilis]